MRLKIRWKLLILLLGIALGPLIVGSTLDHHSMFRLGRHVGRNVREVLEADARRHLRRMVDDYGQIITGTVHTLELALRVQALEVERRLAGPLPPAGRHYFSADYDRGEDLPTGMKASPIHLRADGKGELSPVAVTYDEQVYVVAPKVDRREIAEDLRRLASMPGVYRRVRQGQADLTYWQYTSMESGFHTCYPGHGGYQKWYDPRKRPFYQFTRRAGRGEVVWLPPWSEVSTRTVVLGLAMQVFGPDGKFAGVTAIDIDPAGTFKKFELPEHWRAGAKALLVIPGVTGAETAGKIVILAETGHVGRTREWAQTEKWRLLEGGDADKLIELKAEAMAGRSGVRRMPHAGRDALWAWGPGRGGDRAFPIVIVPYDQVVAEAAGMEADVWGRTRAGLQITAALLLGVIVVVVGVAYFSARSVTRPVIRLADVAHRLAAGDYDTRIDIRTGDELQELGETFTDLGPKLREREKMKQSLALAVEIQQHLLPAESPALDGFDIAGQSNYCDETGGDYYDFINLVALGGGKLGIAVGDVTGHGIGAALLMASARGVLRSHAESHVDDLDRLFGMLNAHLVRDTGDQWFMTLFYGVLDADTRTLRWASGGHDPALWVRRHTGGVEELPNTGIPLGVLEGVDFAQAGPVQLESGDIVVIGTDGIWEASNPDGEMFGKDRLREILSAGGDRTAREIHEAVVSAVHAFRADGPQEDDITAVVIRAL